MYKIKININCEKCINDIQNIIGNDIKIIDYSFTKEYIVVECGDHNILSVIVKLKKAGYIVGEYKETNNENNYLINTIIIGVMLLFIFLGNKIFPSIELGTEFSMTVVIVFALLSGFHCVSMCGAIALKQHQASNSKEYYIGRVISYSVIGFTFGLLGSVISLNQTFIMTISILAGIFLILLGLSSIDIVKLPKIKTNVKYKGQSGFILGLLNGILPCAVLQIMWIYVITLANPIYGLITMFLIAVISSLFLWGFCTIGEKLSFFRSKFFRYALAIYVIFLGINMTTNTIKQYNAQQTPTNEVTEVEQPTTSDTTTDTTQQYVLDANYNLDGGDIPVNQEVTIYFDKEKQNGCNEKFVLTLPDGQEFYIDLNEMDSITFTATQTGTATMECWMSMRSGSFEIIE